MLAASARRAGYAPLVVDSFGDSDTRELAAEFEIIPDAYVRGFRLKQLAQALEKLAARSPVAPIGLVLGAGFEESPRLVAALARRFRLIGCSAETIARCKQPGLFFPLLRELGIPHPETRLDAPKDGDGWLRRRIGGSGGTHIVPVRLGTGPGSRADKRHYFQRRAEGTPVSLSGVVGRHGLALGFSEQWPEPRPRHPFRFGGAVGPVTLDADAEARMIDIAVHLVKQLDLTGLVSFDFVLSGDQPLLLEVNPRPGATLDLFDDANGSHFAAHIAATLDPASLPRLIGNPPPPGASALSYIYADSAPFTLPATHAWADWTSDRPLPGATIPRFAPIATVHAAAANPFAARELVLNRCQGLALEIEEGRSGKGTTS